ncbi:hypothetical protein BJ166DRAFT_352899 [Pestalotiopsis sp. NC0098]|nr:hypothetical protein BJ166DRAFT_352899 [Pestalotiopsis sp. NC0098]
MLGRAVVVLHWQWAWAVSNTEGPESWRSPRRSGDATGIPLYHLGISLNTTRYGAVVLDLRPHVHNQRWIYSGMKDQETALSLCGNILQVRLTHMRRAFDMQRAWLSRNENPGGQFSY